MNSGPFGYLLYDGTVTPLPTPKGAVSFARPMVSFDQRGRVGVVWAEQGTVDSVAVASDQLREPSLWFAERSTTTWFRARNVKPNARLRWGDFSAMPAFSLGGKRHVIIAAFSDSGGPVVLHFRFSSDTAFVDEIRALRGILVEYLTAVGFGREGILVGYSSGGEVRVVQSDNEGDQWRSPVEVHITTSGQVKHLRAAKDDSVVHLVWGTGGPNDFTARTLAHAELNTKTNKWSAVAEEVVPGGVYNPQIAVDRCGATHVVFGLIADPAHPRIGYARVEGNKWHLNDDGPFSELASDAGIGVDGIDPVVVWTEFDTGRSGRRLESITTMYARLRRSSR
ncbi:MAG TPA: hypothetical protein VIP11_17225 [Gemmatimonadaceae bacterium]